MRWSPRTSSANRERPTTRRSSVVYTDPQAAAVGAGEGSISATVPLSEVAKTATYTSAYAEENGFLTLLSDGERLTGAYALGPEAGEWLQQATLAIRASIPLEVLADTIQPFPTFSEVYVVGAARAPPRGSGLALLEYHQGLGANSVLPHRGRRLVRLESLEHGHVGDLEDQADAVRAFRSLKARTEIPRDPKNSSRSGRAEPFVDVLYFVKADQGWHSRHLSAGASVAAAHVRGRRASHLNLDPEGFLEQVACSR